MSYQVTKDDDWPVAGVALMPITGHDRNWRPSVSHQNVSFATLDCLTGIMTSRAACFGGLDVLAVNHTGGRTGFTAGALAIKHHQVMVQAFPGSIIVKPHESATHRLV
jgi:hypothetical protein